MRCVGLFLLILFGLAEPVEAKNFYILYEPVVLDHKVGQISINGEQQKELKRVMDNLQKTSVISKVEVATWGDQATPEGQSNEELEVLLANLRGRHVRSYIQQHSTHKFPILTYNMHQDLDWLFENIYEDGFTLNQGFDNSNSEKILSPSHRLMITNSANSRSVVVFTLKKMSRMELGHARNFSTEF